MMLRAILFDFYGTLAKVTERPFSRRLPEALGVRREAWVALVRDGLMTRTFADAASFAEFVARALAPERLAAAAATCTALIDAECASVAIVPGIASLLPFLKRRGIKLGLVSNLASPFKVPVATLGLAEAFDAEAYSCDEGLTKPDPEIYSRVLTRLETSPEHALFVGDNLLNDVNAPAALGLRTAGVGVAGRDATLGSAAEIGLLDFSATPLERLLSPGDVVAVGDTRGRVTAIQPTPDDDQGRYNLVFRCDIDTARGGEVVYAKRFLLPETVHVETFAYQLQALTGLRACAAAIHPGREDLLLLTAAAGRKWQQTDLCEETAYALGAHFVFALLFSNADIRPRNAFVDDGRVMLVDLEHCFFNLAIDTTGLAASHRPETFDGLPADELVARTKKTVLSARAKSRARRSFFTDTPKGSPVDEAFHQGFIDFYRRQHARADEIAGVLLDRVHTEPPLVIGTHAYRRALAEVDIADIRARLMMDAQVAYDETW